MNTETLAKIASILKAEQPALDPAPHPDHVPFVEEWANWTGVVRLFGDLALDNGYAGLTGTAARARFFKDAGVSA